MTLLNAEKMKRKLKKDILKLSEIEDGIKVNNLEMEELTKDVFLVINNVPGKYF